MVSHDSALSGVGVATAVELGVTHTHTHTYTHIYCCDVGAAAVEWCNSGIVYDIALMDDWCTGCCQVGGDTFIHYLMGVMYSLAIWGTGLGNSYFHTSIFFMLWFLLHDRQTGYATPVSKIRAFK